MKIGHVHAGLGKIKLQEHSDFEDLASVLCLHRVSLKKNTSFYLVFEKN